MDINKILTRINQQIRDLEGLVLLREDIMKFRDYAGANKDREKTILKLDSEIASRRDTLAEVDHGIVNAEMWLEEVQAENKRASSLLDTKLTARAKDLEAMSKLHDRELAAMQKETDAEAKRLEGYLGQVRATIATEADRLKDIRKQIEKLKGM
jgi:Skp family chaperone for outer membrane proteins